MRVAPAVALSFACFATATQAAEFSTLEVEHQAGVYTVRAEVWIDAPLPAVRAALLDFPHLTRLADSIRESRVVGETRDGVLVYTRTKACAGWFCRSVRQTQLVRTEGDRIIATAVPEQSNVSVGHTEWRLGEEWGGTRMLWTTVVDPAFFVPPLIGPPLVKAALRREGEELATGLERVANGEEPVREPRRKPRRPRGAGPGVVDDG